MCKHIFQRTTKATNCAAQKAIGADITQIEVAVVELAEDEVDKPVVEATTPSSSTTDIVSEPTTADSIEEIYGEHCIQRIKSVGKYDQPKLGDSRVLSPSGWIKSKMHVVGDSIDYKHSDDVTPDFRKDGYTYLLQYQFDELDESQILDNFFFKSSEDRESFEQANIEWGVKYFLATKSYDERLYHLCMVI
ncbi:hypothetical protein GQ600_12199 [Phytophthora cactorum]|nr:hypothetical protein GQ600_12199 [Phytophthora cactorum]